MEEGYSPDLPAVIHGDYSTDIYGDNGRSVEVNEIPLQPPTGNEKEDALLEKTTIKYPVFFTRAKLNELHQAAQSQLISLIGERGHPSPFLPLFASPELIMAATAFNYNVTVENEDGEEPVKIKVCEASQASPNSPYRLRMARMFADTIGASLCWCSVIFTYAEKNEKLYYLDPGFLDEVVPFIGNFSQCVHRAAERYYLLDPEEKNDIIALIANELVEREVLPREAIGDLFKLPSFLQLKFMNSAQNIMSAFTKVIGFRSNAANCISDFCLAAREAIPLIPNDGFLDMLNPNDRVLAYKQTHEFLVLRAIQTVLNTGSLPYNDFGGLSDVDRIGNALEYMYQAYEACGPLVERLIKFLLQAPPNNGFPVAVALLMGDFGGAYPMWAPGVCTAAICRPYTTLCTLFINVMEEIRDAAKRNSYSNIMADYAAMEASATGAQALIEALVISGVPFDSLHNYFAPSEACNTPEITMLGNMAGVSSEGRDTDTRTLRNSREPIQAADYSAIPRDLRADVFEDISSMYTLGHIFWDSRTQCAGVFTKARGTKVVVDTYTNTIYTSDENMPSWLKVLVGTAPSVRITAERMHKVPVDTEHLYDGSGMKTGSRFICDPLDVSELAYGESFEEICAVPFSAVADIHRHLSGVDMPRLRNDVDEHIYPVLLFPLRAFAPTYILTENSEAATHSDMPSELFTDELRAIHQVCKEGYEDHALYIDENASREINNPDSRMTMGLSVCVPPLSDVNEIRQCAYTKFSIDGDTSEYMVPVLLANNEFVPFHEADSEAIIDVTENCATRTRRGLVLSSNSEYASMVTPYTSEAQRAQGAPIESTLLRVGHVSARFLECIIYDSPDGKPLDHVNNGIMADADNAVFNTLRDYQEGYEGKKIDGDIKIEFNKESVGLPNGGAWGEINVDVRKFIISPRSFDGVVNSMCAPSAVSTMQSFNGVISEMTPECAAFLVTRPFVTTLDLAGLLLMCDYVRNAINELSGEIGAGDVSPSTNAADIPKFDQTEEAGGGLPSNEASPYADDSQTDNGDYVQ